jgi:peptidoglycan/LPS O-acetylase OafA/YrhL
MQNQPDNQILINENGYESSSSSGLSRPYFPELDSIRFFAFLMVFGFHQGFGNLGLLIADGFAMTLDLPLLLLTGKGLGIAIGAWMEHAIKANGWAGVNLFFTLSGFIITHLLLKEEGRFGSIDWLAFWMRRILRIWPLFFLIWFIGFGGIPWPEMLKIIGQGFDSGHALLFAIFLGNWSMIWQGPVGSDILSVLWSVCVEEQFYLFIPIALTLLGSRARIGFCVLGIAAAVIRRYQLAALGVPQYQMTYDTLAQMDSILSGVLLALILNRPARAEMMQKLTQRYLVWLMVPLTFFLLSRNHLGHDVAIRRVLDPLAIAAVSACWVLLALYPSPRWGRLLSWPVWVRLGQISYGLYMWHEVVLTLCGGGLMAFLITILVSIASFQLFERPILRLKKRWTKLKTRPV